MPKFDPEYEEWILKAIGTLPEDGIANLKAVAEKFEVDYHALRRRYYSVLDVQSKGGHKSRLTEAQDHALCRRIRTQVKHGFLMRKA